MIPGCFDRLPGMCCNLIRASPAVLAKLHPSAAPRLANVVLSLYVTGIKLQGVASSTPI